MRILDLPHFQQCLEQKVKVLRHKDRQRDLWEFVRMGKFEQYQNGQSRDVFGMADCIISFIAERNKYAKFVGGWTVQKHWTVGKRHRYRTQKLPGFDDLHGRLIVRWGDGARSWAQWLHLQGNKEVIEILPPSYVMDFPGFYDFTLTYAQLCEMIRNPDSNREWFRMLSSISGVYIVLDTRSGRQYVGSAYGLGGIWGRWSQYVKNPSGGNKFLKQLLSLAPQRYRAFQFSILRVLEPGTTKDVVLRHEALLKRKLGSRVFGLN